MFAALAGAITIGVGCSAFTSTPNDDANDGSADDRGDAATTTDGDAPFSGDSSPADSTSSCTACASRSCSGSTGACDPLVFVTAAVFTASQVQSLQHADIICTQAAQAVGRIGTFKAWLSDSASNCPNNRFLKSTRPYRRIDGKAIAQSYDDLVTGSPIALEVPLSITEKDGPAPAAYAWTATAAVGGPFPQSCSDWMSDSGDGVVGSTAKTTDAWSFETTPSSQPCNSTLPLYCFEQLPP